MNAKIPSRWPHQNAMLDYAHEQQACMLAASMGTGKTRSIIDLIRQDQIAQTLILCPLSVTAVWRREFSKWFPEIPILICDRGTVAQRAQTAQRFVNTHSQAVIVINYDSAWRTLFGQFVLSRQWNLVVLDESQRVSGHNTRISKFCCRLRAKAAKRICMTGTPMGTPLHIFGQYRFLDPEIFGHFWHKFRTQYAILKTIPGVAAQIVDGYRNLDELHERFASIALQISDDVLEIPEITHQQIDCELRPKAIKAYRSLEHNLIAEIEGGVVTASNALVRLLRLQQVTSGFLPDEDWPDEFIVIDESKRTALADLIDGIDSRDSIVVFCRFRHDLRLTRDVAESLGREYREVSGSVKQLTDHATMLDVQGQVLGVQIQSGGVGIDLTQAHYAVYYSLGFSLTDYQQSVKRLHRPGQRHHVHCYRLICTDTVDEKVYRAINLKRDVVRSVLEGFQKKTYSEGVKR